MIFCTQLKSGIAIVVLAIIITFSSCLGTPYIFSKTGATFEERIPCRVKVLMKLEESDKQKYTFIGTCESERNASGYRGKTNNAFIQIEKCACTNGGDLVIIVNEKAKLGHLTYNIIEEAVKNNDPQARGVVHSDRIKAKIYRKNQ